MFGFLTEWFRRKTHPTQQQKDSASQPTQPICYMLIKESARMEALDIMSYLTGGENSRLQLTYQRFPEDFGFRDQRQLFSRYRCYNSIVDLIRSEYEFMGGNPNPKSSYILCFGFEKTTVLSLIKSGQFHLAIIDAINLKDLWFVYSPDDIFSRFDSPPLPIPTERVEIIENPDFSPTSPNDISEKTTSSVTCKC